RTSRLSDAAGLAFHKPRYANSAAADRSWVTSSNASRMAIGLPANLWRAEMRRRDFIAGLASAAAWPLTALAQQRTKATVIWFDARPGLAPPEQVEAFRRGLAQVGFSEGRDVTLEYHTADGHLVRLPALAADVVNRRPAAIFAV